MKLLKILGILMLITAVTFSGCMDDTSETEDNGTVQNNVSNPESSINISKTEQNTSYNNSEVVLNISNSSNEKHDAYIIAYPNRTDDYYLKHPKETEILDNLASKLDKIISENYVLECHIKTYETYPESSECNATIYSNRLIIDNPFITGAVETINYINETYKINNIQVTAIDADTGEVYFKMETSGPSYENIKLTFKYMLGDEFQITYWNKDLKNYTIESLN